MLKKITVIFICLLFFNTIKSKAQQAKSGKADALKLFSNFYGDYSCEGGNARGQMISADISFTPEFNGEAMVYEHIDHPPLKAHSKAIWNYDGTSRQLVSLSVFAIKDTSLTISALFVAEQWSTDSIMFKADTLVAPPFRPNRFIYKKNGDDSLHITWQVKQDDQWVVGDHLQCVEKKSAE